VIDLKYKNYTRSPQYGKIYSYNETGKQTHELNILGLELEHEGVEYTVAGLLKTVTEDSADVEKLFHLINVQAGMISELQNEVGTLKIKTDALLKALQKLTAEVGRIASSNKGI
jgi:hypothetical protein